MQTDLAGAMRMNRTTRLARVFCLFSATALASEAVPESGARCKPDWTMEGQPAPLHTYHGDQYYSLKQAGVRADPEELLGVLISDADIKLRLPALSAIEHCNFRETKAALEEYLEDPASNDLRKLLTTILLKWGSSKAKAYVRDIVSNSSNRDRARLEWYPAHINYGGECDWNFVRGMVSSEDSVSRSMSASTVGALLGRPEYIEDGKALMRTLLHDAEASVRTRALWNLYEEASKGQRPDLCQIMTEVAGHGSDADLRGKAAEYLGELQTLKKCVGSSE